jgi:hypothetical protein
MSTYATPSEGLNPLDQNLTQPDISIAPPATNGTNGVPPQHQTQASVDQIATVNGDSQFKISCGPLLRYIGQGEDDKLWRGSVLIVAEPSQAVPQLHFRCIGSRESEGTSLEASTTTSQTVEALKLYESDKLVWWRFSLNVLLQDFEARWEYQIPNLEFLPGPRKTTSNVQTFFVPGKDQSMRIMFHSCNGFSVGVPEDEWSGPALWNDVLRIHKEHPFHVMIGGGDQIYNDGIRVTGPLKEWTAIKNPVKRRNYEFDAKLSKTTDDFYLANYIRWYSTEPFSTANAQIPQVNIWDDHDIIDGFGSYTDAFMRCPVFMGVGAVAFKYYLLFQHHTIPPSSGGTDVVGRGGVHTYETKQPLEQEPTDESWILGAKPGPYITEQSRSIYSRFGKRVAFFGLDARTERTRHQINYPETYDKCFARLEAELTKAPEIKHLIVLLGVPIAYPRLVWMENILTSPLIAPLRFLNKRFGVAGGLFNQFDGQVDILDDLDDHYTARHHKKERNEFVERLQALSQKFSVRITILGGDVHLCAIGRFYSNPRLGIPAENDHRYIVNIISSAITNKPPPSAVANMIASRNKIHHLNKESDETLMSLFDKEPGGISRTSASNRLTMPSRNFAVLTESFDEGAFVDRLGYNEGNMTNHEDPENYSEYNPQKQGRQGHRALHPGEHKAGASHAAAEGAVAGKGGVDRFGLSVALRVECNREDRSGKTEGFGFSIPSLSKPSTA